MHIKVNDVSKIYKTGKKALSNISIDMKSPNLIGLLGPNGAGKSTLMKLLVAAMLPSNGCITADGKPILKQEKAFKSRLGYLPQSFGLYDELSVYQFLDYMAALKGIKNSKRAIESVIAETNLGEKRKARIGSLSGGQRQRVGIAQALLGSPEFMIFDESTVGLDPEERISFRNLFSREARNKIVLLSTHIIEDVQSTCNRLIVISGGHICFDGTPELLITHAQGHVGIVDERHSSSIGCGQYTITSRINTSRGVLSRVVADRF